MMFAKGIITKEFTQNATKQRSTLQNIKDLQEAQECAQAQVEDCEKRKSLHVQMLLMMTSLDFRTCWRDYMS